MVQYTLLGSFTFHNHNVMTVSYQFEDVCSQRARSELPGGRGGSLRPFRAANQTPQEQEEEDSQWVHLHLGVCEVHHVLLQLHLLADGTLADRGQWLVFHLSGKYY